MVGGGMGDGDKGLLHDREGTDEANGDLYR